MRWGDRYLADPDGPPVRLTHAGCDAPVEVTLRCADGHLLDSARDVRPVERARA
jgi:hypothetical protein